MFKVQSSAPTRVDLAGGTLDLWPIYNLLERKATVNLAVGLQAKVTIEPSPSKNYTVTSEDQNSKITGSFKEVIATKSLSLIGLILAHTWREELPPLNITTAALSPAGAGLGGSSCLAVTTITAMLAAKSIVTGKNHDLDEDGLVRTAQDIESRIIFAPTGTQDYWGAVRGGLNIIRYAFGSIKVETLTTKPWERTQSSLLCVYSGKSRASAINNWEIFKRILDGDQRLLSSMQDIGNLADDCAVAITSGDWNRALEASRMEWEIRKQLWPAVETTETKAINSAAVKSGALFSRVCGAGGGGVMAVATPTECLERVKKAVTDAGGQVLETQNGCQGLKVEGRP